MKIGILTFNSAHNYGAVLQAWALQEKLKEEGHYVEIINYRLPVMDNLYRLYKPKNPFKHGKMNRLYHITQYLKVKKENPKKVRQYNKFEKFINQTLHATAPIKAFGDLNKAGFDYDVMIAGSDQIWNGALTKGINAAYFLAFGNENMKRISYAASIGRDEIPEIEKLLFSRYLRNFDYISVREEKAKEAIQELTWKDISVVADPTLLLAREKYDALKKDPKVKQEYIYVHNVHLTKIDNRLNTMAEELSKRLGVPIVHNRADYHFGNELYQFTDGSPEEFVGWIANAKYVIANSFHATVFSIIYHRDFITIPHFQNPERMRHLLESLGIGEHLIGNIEDLPKNLETLTIDYEKVESLRAEQKEESLSFLHKALNGEKTTREQPDEKRLYFDSKDVFACYGCSACKDVCPTHAITMKADKEGFWYPVIDDMKCIHCNLCRKVCIYKERDKQEEPGNIVEYPKVYAAFHKEEKVRSESTSGGMFTPMYQNILSKGGQVAGVKYNKKMEVVYGMGKTEEECEAFRGSKYVAVNNEGVKPKVKKLLEDGIPVLFSGSPCQIAGLKSYLRKDYSNLYTVEIICHGTPSPKVFGLYIEYLEKLYQSKVVDFEFRNKIRGWSKPYVCVKFESDEVLLELASRNNFNRAFLSNNIQRPSCYTCEFASLKLGIGDITIGDYWGIQKEHPERMDEKGVSIIKVNNQKGQELFDQIQDSFDLLETTYEKAYAANHKKPMNLAAKRNQLMSQIDDEEINSLLLSFNHLKKKGR